MPKPKIDLEVTIVGEHNCWKTNLTPNNWGYVRIWMNTEDGRKKFFVHRLTYEELIGEIPEGYHLHHAVCNNTWCVNPWHVVPITPKDHNTEHKKGHIYSEYCYKGHKKGYTKNGRFMCKECNRLHQQKLREERKTIRSI